MQKWIPRAAAIGAVSGQGIPDDLQDRCVNLSDAVDTEFFTPAKARPIPLSLRPVVLLPARIGGGKGHHDLLEAASILITRKIDFVVCFAGAVDSESLQRELRRAVPPWVWRSGYFFFARGAQRRSRLVRNQQRGCVTELFGGTAENCN